MCTDDWHHRCELCDECVHVALTKHKIKKGYAYKRYCRIDVKPQKTYNYITGIAVAIILTCPDRIEISTHVWKDGRYMTPKEAKAWVPEIDNLGSK